MNLEILQLAEDAFKYGYVACRRFPKSERFTLVADIKREMILIISLIIRANKNKNDRLGILRQIDVELDVLRSLIRISKDMEFLTVHQYEIWSRHVNEVGKRLGGWIKKPQ